MANLTNIYPFASPIFSLVLGCHAGYSFPLAFMVSIENKQDIFTLFSENISYFSARGRLSSGIHRHGRTPRGNGMS